MRAGAFHLARGRLHQVAVELPSLVEPVAGEVPEEESRGGGGRRGGARRHGPDVTHGGGGQRGRQREARPPDPPLKAGGKGLSWEEQR